MYVSTNCPTCGRCRTCGQPAFTLEPMPFTEIPRPQPMTAGADFVIDDHVSTSDSHGDDGTLLAGP